MQITFCTEDLKTAPRAVQQWIICQLFDGQMMEAPLETKPEATQTTDIQEEPKKKPTRKRRSKPHIDADASPEPESTPEPVEEVVEAGEITADMLKAAAMKLIEKEGPPALAAALKSVGCSRISNCPPADYPQLLAALAVQ